MSNGSQSDTIVALSSGHLPSGIAVIRATGPKARDLCALFSVQLPEKRVAKFAKFVSPQDQSILDEGLVLFFPGPNSFSGEDLLEFQLHGSRAVVDHFVTAATAQEDIRLAQPGEFTRRAFESGKLDLTRVEGIADLIDAQTETQRSIAVARMRGGLSEKATDWRDQIIRLRAEIEARLDFSDEDDVPFDLPTSFIAQIKNLKTELQTVVDQFEEGRMAREGTRVALIGAPNAGKSSLLNALSRSEVAIVTEIAGTTRDSIETDVSIDGHLFRFVDTAGIRETSDIVEQKGIERSFSEAARADLTLFLTEDGSIPVDISFDWLIETKSDSRETIQEMTHVKQIATSSNSNDGLNDLKNALLDFVGKNDSRETLLISHHRDKEALLSAINALENATKLLYTPELLAEELRTATYHLQRLLGVVDTEDVLDKLFSGFCIGK